MTDHLTLEEIVAELDRIADNGLAEGVETGDVVADVEDLANRIRPPEKRFWQVPCMSLDPHNEHIWHRTDEERSLYCPGRE